MIGAGDSLFSAPIVVFKGDYMITEVCLYLRNWFNRFQPRFYGQFRIKDGVLISLHDGDMGIQTNQYYRIIGSVFNDGVYKRGSEELVDEEWDGAVWLMAVPKDVEQLASDIKEWQTKYGSASSQNMSPFQSESFGGYSYSKGSGGSGGSSSSSVPTWQAVFADRLARYKKL